MIAVLKHELRLYFHSLTAYVFGAFLLVFIGFGSMLYNLQAAVSNFEFVLSFGCLVFVVIVPVLTMRVIAEERKQRTDQLLYSLPITTTQVIVGKYLALLTVYVIPLCLICLYPVIFSQFGDVYLLTSYASLFAFFVMGAALIALGMFISSLTESQGFAAGIGIAVILLNYYSVSLSEHTSSSSLGAFLSELMTKLSLFERFYSFVNGVFDMTALVYYVTFAVFFLFLSVQSLEKRRYNSGAYSPMLTGIVLAILVVVNVFASALPTTLTKYDISSTKLYSITSNTKVVVNGLDQDVTIYWIVQSGKEDEVIENLLGKYESLSDHIEVVKKNPDIFPTFAEQYTEEMVENNSLVVECGERSRFIGYRDIYVQEADMFSYTYNTSFDGEGAITSAIDYVVNEELPQVYILEGHGEKELPSSFSEQMEKENMEIHTLSLLTVDSIPEEAGCILIYGPSSDISEEEKNMLTDYVADGGKLFVMAGPTEDDGLDNLYGILKEYGVERTEGIVVESDREHFAFQTPYALLPEMADSEITNSLIEENYYPILPVSQGMTVTGSSSKGTVTELLTTSMDAFSKIAGFGLSTYEREEGDIDGPFAVAVSVEDNSGGEIVWFSSSEFMNDMYNAYSSGANGDLGMNALSSLIGESEAVAIRSKSLNYNYLTISESTSSLLKVLMIGVFPLAYLGIGICVILERRRKQNETV